MFTVCKFIWSVCRLCQLFARTTNCRSRSSLTYQVSRCVSNSVNVVSECVLSAEFRAYIADPPKLPADVSGLIVCCTAYCSNGLVDTAINYVYIIYHIMWLELSAKLYRRVLMNWISIPTHSQSSTTHTHHGHTFSIPFHPPTLTIPNTHTHTYLHTFNTQHTHTHFQYPTLTHTHNTQHTHTHLHTFNTQHTHTHTFNTQHSHLHTFSTHSPPPHTHTHHSQYSSKSKSKSLAPAPLVPRAPVARCNSNSKPTASNGKSSGKCE